MNLNIIGNGFDLYHGLPSSYYYFGCYLIEENPSLYMEMSDWFRFRYYSEARGYPYEDFEYGVENQFWSTFEEKLGIVDENAILGKYDYDLGLEIEDYDIPMEDDRLADEIREAFISWVSVTLDVSENYSIVRRYKMQNPDTYIMRFSKKDKFLVFNYTHTLQELYGIHEADIYYIHGECTGDKEDDLIFGHANKERMKEIQKIIEKYDKRSLYQSERTRQLEYECLLRFMRSLEKNVDGCKGDADYFYRSFKEKPLYINVYGMSLGEVDYPYLEQVRKRWMDAKWRFSYFSSGDKERIDVIADRLGIGKEQYKKFKFDNPMHRKIEEEIVKKLGIVTYAPAE